MKSAFITLLSLVFFASCSDYSKVFKSKNATLKYNKAVELYNKKSYDKALPLFEQLREVYKGADSMELVYYYTAYCHFGRADYEYASMFFKDYTESFSRSPRLAECAYMAVYCDFMDVGTYELDQSNTKIVIGELQTFINYYPNSSYAVKCNEHIDLLRKKLQQKDYEMVIQYFDQGHYRAAVVSARNTLKSFPDIEQKEELELMTIKAQYLYALNSIEKKRLERFQEALENYKEYIYLNGTAGQYYKNAQALKVKIDNNIQKLTNTI